MKKIESIFLTLILLLSLSACGGGGSDSSTVETPSSTTKVLSNKAPIANAGIDKTAELNHSIVIEGTGIDSDGNITAYEWKKGTTVLASTASFNYTPTVLGTDTLVLTVTDNNGATDSDSVQINIVISKVCTPDTSLVGGIYSDSDGSAFKMDDSFSLAHTSDFEPSVEYTQAQYRQMLSEPIYIQNNLHKLAGNHYHKDFKDASKNWPETAHVLLRYIQANGRNSLLVGYDGVSGEGMNYHFFWLYSLEKFAATLNGYTDPDGWVPPKGVKKITKPLTHDDIMPHSARWNSMITSALMLTLPDGTDSGSHDTGLQYHDGSTANQASAWGAGGYHYGYGIEKTAKSYLLPAYGQLGLGSGRLGNPNLQTQSILHFSPKASGNGHAHNDTLMMGLFGRGRNLLSFPGHQNQSHGPQNKNMVMVNGAWQNRFMSDTAGRLEIFASLPGLQISRVDASHIMHGGNANGTGGTFINRYRRTYLQNTIDIEKSYLIDIFEVDGGSSHDFLMRGSGVLVQEYPSTTLSLSDGTMPISDSKEAVFSDTKKAMYDANESFWVDINFSDKPKFGTRSHFPSQEEVGELYLNYMTEQWTDENSSGIPQYTLHRSGLAPLKSTFIALHEVLDGSGSSFIDSVTKESLDSDSIAIKVTLKNGRVDTYLVSFDGQKNMTYNGVSANAVIASSSSFAAKSDLWMVGGSSVDNGTRILNNSNQELNGTIININREEDGASSNSFDTDMVLPFGYKLANQVLLLENFEDGSLKYVNSYIIDHIEDVCDKTRIFVRSDPGVAISSSLIKELHYPRREATSARLRFIFSDTTVPSIVNVSPGKNLQQRINPQVGYPLNINENVELTTVPEGARVVYKLNSSLVENITINATLPINGDSDVIMSAQNIDGFVVSQEIEEKYYKLQAATIGTAGEKGLIAKRYTGYTYNFDLDDPLNSYDFNRLAPSEVVTGLSFEQVPYEQVAAGSGVIVSGYVDVPTTGLYSFFTRMDRAVQLKIDDKVIVYDPGMRGVAQWRGELYLEKGFHKIEVHHYSQVNSHFCVMWEGPGISYGEIPTKYFFQNVN